MIQFPSLIWFAFAAFQQANTEVVTQLASGRLIVSPILKDRMQVEYSWIEAAVTKLPYIKHFVKVRLAGRSGFVEFIDESPRERVFDTRTIINPLYQFSMVRRDDNREWLYGLGTARIPENGTFDAIRHPAVAKYMPWCTHRFSIRSNSAPDCDFLEAIRNPDYAGRFRKLAEGEYLLSGSYRPPEGGYRADFQAKLRMPANRDWAIFRSTEVVYTFDSPPTNVHLQRESVTNEFEERGESLFLNSTNVERQYRKGAENLNIENARFEFKYTPLEIDENSPEFFAPHYGFPTPDYQPSPPPVFPNAKNYYHYFWLLVLLPLAGGCFFLARRLRKRTGAKKPGI